MVANAKISTNSKINIEELIFYFPHTLGKTSIDITPTRIKIQDMKIIKWNLSKEDQIRPLNLGTHKEPNW
jgi:archaellin